MVRFALPLWGVILALTPTIAADPFQFQDGDRVVIIGSTLIEREQKYGGWELALSLKNRDKAVTFRNLGWSGDTVWGEARNGFDPNPKGYERLISLALELKPTVIILCYGQNESFDGPAGLPKFTAQYEKLLDALAPAKARMVLMTPTPFQKAGPLKDPAPLNKNLALYCEAIKAIAAKRKLESFDLFEKVSAMPVAPATDNGVHLTGDGYRATAVAFLAGGASDPVASLLASSVGTDSPLLSMIRDKNQLFFHRWRPQNETYLFGFRKHEQGKNAKEVAEFDPLVAAAEKEINEQKKVIK